MDQVSWFGGRSYLELDLSTSSTVLKDFKSLPGGENCLKEFKKTGKKHQTKFSMHMGMFCYVRGVATRHDDLYPLLSKFKFRLLLSVSASFVWKRNTRYMYFLICLYREAAHALRASCAHCLHPAVSGQKKSGTTNRHAEWIVPTLQTEQSNGNILIVNYHLLS